MAKNSANGNGFSKKANHYFHPILSLVLLAVTLVIEILRQTVPPHTVMPTSTEGIITVFRNIAFVFFALFFTVFLFLTFKNRFGKIRAVFYTLYSDCLIGFFIGVLITVLAGSQNSAAFGITPLESIYYYFLGLLVMTISVFLILIGILAYAIIMGIIDRKLKKHQRGV